MYELLDLHNLKITLFNDLNNVNSNLYQDCKERLLLFHMYLIKYIKYTNDFIEIISNDYDDSVEIKFKSYKPFILENDMCMTKSGVLFIVVSHEPSKFSIVYQINKLRRINDTFVYDIKYIDSFTTQLIILDNYKRIENDPDKMLREFMGYASLTNSEIQEPVFEMFHGMDGVNIRLLKVVLDEDNNDDKDDDDNLVRFNPQNKYDHLSVVNMSTLKITHDPVKNVSVQTGVYEMIIYYTGIFPHTNNLEFQKNVMIETYVKRLPPLNFLFDAINSQQCISVILPTRGEWDSMDWNDIVLNVNKDIEKEMIEENELFTKYRIEPNPNETLYETFKSKLNKSYTDDFFVLRSKHYGFIIVLPMENYIIPTTQPFLYIDNIQRFYREFKPNISSAVLNYPQRRIEPPSSFFKKIMKTFLIAQFDYSINEELLNSKKLENTKIINIIKQIKQIKRYITNTDSLNALFSSTTTNMQSICYNLKFKPNVERITMVYDITDDRIFDIFNIIIHMFNDYNDCTEIISSLSFIHVVYDINQLTKLRNNMLIPGNRHQVSDIIHKTFYIDDNYDQSNLEEVLSSDTNVFITFIAISIFNTYFGSKLIETKH